MPPTKRQQYTALSDLFAHRREAILLAWRKADRADPEQTTGRSLTRGQFFDHIPQMLDAFEHRMRSRPGGAEAEAAASEEKREGVKHGLHRWQQGYRLQELINECGHLQLCLFQELAGIASAHPDLEHETIEDAQRQILALINDTISESAGQYERMQQAESAGHVGDLLGALASVNEIERRRATLIHQVVHDLNSDVMGVALAASLLDQTRGIATQQTDFTIMLKQGMNGLTSMLGELMELARLEAGQETRKLGTFDVAALIGERCDGNRPFALERKLFLETNGPDSLTVEGDPEKLRRLLQNLLMNALKYTPSGGVTVSWGAEQENWWLMVRDTGPGMSSQPGAPLLSGLQEATASAKESDENAAADQGKPSQVLNAPSDTEAETTPSAHQPGEGIGLSIVKRLCELLDASLEVASSPETGTTFRVVLPRQYRHPA
jgi:signal transduction histidine kinase